jgi:hypothetical protein
MEEVAVGNEATEVNGQDHKAERSRPTLGRTFDQVVYDQRKPR